MTRGSEVKVSLYCASNRPRLWLWFYDTVKHNKIPFEIVFAGDVAPDYELPPNFRFIYTTVKVSQANFVAALECKGETLLHIGDDIQLMQPNALELMYDLYVKENTEKNTYKTMIWAKYGHVLSHSKVEEFHRTTQGVLMSRKLFRYVGGYDRRYFCNTYDVDLHYRIQSRRFNGKYVICPDVCVFHRDDLNDFETVKKQSGWFKWNGERDVNFLYSQWGKYGSQFLPTTPFQPFEINSTLYSVSQGTGAEEWDAVHPYFGPMKKESAGNYSSKFNVDIDSWKWSAVNRSPQDPPVPNVVIYPGGMPRVIG